MACTTEMAERHGRVLAELTELSLSLARGLEARAKAAQTLEEAQGLALAFQRAARSVRLCLDLEVRLTRERQAVDSAERFRSTQAVKARKAQVSAAVTRAVQAETEGRETERLLEDLDDRLYEEALYEAFAEGPVEACIARIRVSLGLPPDGPIRDPANDPQPAVSAPAALAAAWPPPPHPPPDAVWT
ncbi:hypothetical protein [Phenylobacterium sp.]|jgi:hypothetical protein|uniref:hypothetical protein n=1 Tax=Phenylobacterium sp. TaxID=1871053 RepID=UPI002F403FCD